VFATVGMITDKIKRKQGIERRDLMDEELKKALAARVAQANPSELVVILYDMIDISMEEAETLLESGNRDGFKRELSRAQKSLRELTVTLDMQYDISKQLMPLYLYANRCMIDSLRTFNTVLFADIRAVLKPLGDAFRTIAEQDFSPPVMQHTQQVYAGLTYGPGALNETLVSGASRGYKA